MRESQNLLKETLLELKNNNKTESDVLWVGSSELYFSWDHFKSISNFEYDDGFGGQNIAPNLLVVGSDWWLERHEYDGSEWWAFKTLPVQSESLKNVSNLKSYDEGGL